MMVDASASASDPTLERADLPAGATTIGTGSSAVAPTLDEAKNISGARAPIVMGTGVSDRPLTASVIGMFEISGTC